MHGENTTRDGYPKANEVYEVVDMNGREEDTVQLQGRGVEMEEAYFRSQRMKLTSGTSKTAFTTKKNMLATV